MMEQVSLFEVKVPAHKCRQVCRYYRPMELPTIPTKKRIVPEGHCMHPAFGEVEKRKGNLVLSKFPRVEKLGACPGYQPWHDIDKHLTPGEIASKFPAVFEYRSKTKGRNNQNEM